MKVKLLACAAVIACTPLVSVAAPGASDVERLGKDLTPVGAVKSGNKDGLIPAWAGFTNKPAGAWSPGESRIDASSFRNEKPLFTIDASNVDKYAERLTPSQVEMIKQVNGFKMNVFPSKRECSYPDFVLDNTRKGATQAAIGENGWSLQDAQLPGMPFPIPKTGIEVMWNYLMRYQGAGYVIDNGATTVSAPPGGGSSIMNRPGFQGGRLV